MSVRWITSQLGTGPFLSLGYGDEVSIIDVRDLVDKPGNAIDAILVKINLGCESLRAGLKTVVCCDYGISRSNAIAVGVLSVYENISFDTALGRVLEATGEREIKVELLQAVQRALYADKKNAHGDEMRILITGAAGFLGRAIGPRLHEKFNIFTPSSTELNLQQGSSQLDLLVDQNEINCIIHLANPRVYTSNIALGYSLTMLRNVVDVCTARNIRLIYLSSWEVYAGYSAQYLNADEALPLFPKGPYGEAKYLCELLIEHSRITRNLNCAMLRSSTIYGEGADRPKFILNFINKIKKSEPIVTHQYSNGLPALDLLYIDDFVDILLEVVDDGFVGNLNVGTGVTITTKRIAELLRKICCGTSCISSVSIYSETANIAINSKKAKEIFGWKPKVDIEEGFQLILSNSMQYRS